MSEIDFDVIANLKFAQDAGGAAQKMYDDIQKVFNKPFEVKVRAGGGPGAGNVADKMHGDIQKTFDKPFEVKVKASSGSGGANAADKMHNDIQKKFDKPFDIKVNAGKSGAIGRITSDLTQLEKSLDASNARVIAFGTTVGVIASVQSAFRALVADVARAEQSFTNIQIILQATQSEFQNFQKGIFNVAKETGNTFKDVSQTALEFSRQGLNLTETLDRTRAAMLLTKIAGSDLETSVQAITSALTTFAGQGLTAIDVVSKFSAVDTSFAVSSDDLAEALFRVGNSAEEAGVSLDQLNAIVAATRQTTGRTGPVIGNGLKTIFTRVQRSDTLDQLEKLGVSVRNLEGDSIGAVGILQNLANAFDGFSQAQQKAVAEVVAGGYQINTFLGLLKSVKTGGLFEQAFDISANANPEQLIQRVNEQTSTLIGSFNKLTTSVTEFFSLLGGVGINDFLKKIVGGATAIVDTLSGLFENESGEEIGASLAKGILGGLSNFFSGPGLVLIAKALTGAVSSVAGSVGQATKNFLGIGKEQRDIELILKGANEQLLQQIANESTLAGKVKLVNDQLKQQIAYRKDINDFGNVLHGNVSKDTIKKFKGLADGYLPLDLALLKEQMAIKKGVGGASPSAKPRLENLNIKGKRGDVVVNSDEKIIKNFLGTGEDAVLTPQMLKGLANGFIPNLAFDLSQFKNISSQKNLIDFIESSGIKSSKKGLSRLFFPLDDDLSLKVAFNKAGQAQNEEEFNILSDRMAQSHYGDLLPKLHFADEKNALFGIVDRLRSDFSNFEFTNLTGTGLADAESIFRSSGYPDKTLDQQRKIDLARDKNQFIDKVLSFSEDFDLVPSDFRKSNFGIDDRSQKVKALDVGLSRGVHFNHYGDYAFSDAFENFRGLNRSNSVSQRKRTTPHPFSSDRIPLAEGYIPNFNINFGPNIDKDMIPILMGVIEKSGLSGKIAGTLLGHGSSSLAFDVGENVLKTPYTPTRAFIKTLPEEEQPFGNLYGTLNPQREIGKFKKAESFLNDFPFGFPFDLVHPKAVNIGGIQGLSQRKVEGYDLFDVIRNVARDPIVNKEFGKNRTANILIGGAQKSFEGVNDLFESLGGPKIDFNLPNLMFSRDNSSKLYNVLADIVLKKDKKRLFDLYGQIHTGGIQGSLIDLSSGYIPNLFTDQIYDAFSREISALMSAGYSKEDAIKSLKLDKSHGLRNVNNPMGFGVYNTLQERNLTDARVKHNGHIPSFALPPNRQLDILVKSLSKLEESIYKNRNELQGVSKNLSTIKRAKSDVLLSGEEEKRQAFEKVRRAEEDFKSGIISKESLNQRKLDFFASSIKIDKRITKSAEKYDEEISKLIASKEKFRSEIIGTINQMKSLKGQIQNTREDIRSSFAGRNTPITLPPTSSIRPSIIPSINPREINEIRERLNIAKAQREEVINKGDDDTLFNLANPGHELNRGILKESNSIRRLEKFDNDVKRITDGRLLSGNIFKSFFVSADKEVKGLLKRNKGVVLDKEDRDNLVSSLKSQKGQLRLQAAIGASFAAPLLTSTASSVLFNDASLKKDPENIDRKALLDSFGSNLGLAASGFSFGPLVGAATTLTASFLFLKDVVSKTGESLDQIKLKNQKIAENNRSFSDALTQFNAASRSFSEVVTNPNSTKKDIRAAEVQREAAEAQLIRNTTTDRQRELIKNLSGATSPSGKFDLEKEFFDKTSLNEARGRVLEVLKENQFNTFANPNFVRDLSASLANAIDKESLLKNDKKTGQNQVDKIFNALSDGLSSNALFPEALKSTGISPGNFQFLTEEQKKLVANKLIESISDVAARVKDVQDEKKLGEANVNVSKSFSNLLSAIESRRTLQSVARGQVFENSLNDINNKINENKEFFTSASLVGFERDKNREVINNKFLRDANAAVFESFPKIEEFQGNAEQKKLVLEAFKQFSQTDRNAGNLIELKTELTKIFDKNNETKAAIEEGDATLRKIGEKVGALQIITNGELQRLNATTNSELKILAQGARQALGDPLKRDIFNESNLIGRGIDAGITLNNPFEQRKLAKELKEINTKSDIAIDNRLIDPSANNVLSGNIFRRNQINKQELDQLVARNTGLQEAIKSNLLPSADLFADGVVPKGLDEAQAKARSELSSNQARISELQQGELLQKSFESTFDSLSKNFRGTDIEKILEKERFAIIDLLQRGKQDKVADLLTRLSSTLDPKSRGLSTLVTDPSDKLFSERAQSFLLAFNSIESLAESLTLSSQTQGIFKTKAEEDAKRLLPLTGQPASLQSLTDVNKEEAKGLEKILPEALKDLEKKLTGTDTVIERLNTTIASRIDIESNLREIIGLENTIEKIEEGRRKLNLSKETIVSPEKFATLSDEEKERIGKVKQELKNQKGELFNKKDLLERFFPEIPSQFGVDKNKGIREAISANKNIPNTREETLFLLTGNTNPISTRAAELKKENIELSRSLAYSGKQSKNPDTSLGIPQSLLQSTLPAAPEIDLLQQNRDNLNKILEELKAQKPIIEKRLKEEEAAAKASTEISSNINVSVEGMFGDLGSFIKNTLNDLLKKHVDDSLRRFVDQNKGKGLKFASLPA